MLLFDWVRRLIINHIDVEHVALGSDMNPRDWVLHGPGLHLPNFRNAFAFVCSFDFLRVEDARAYTTSACRPKRYS